ncbi:hypothetical protein [Streptomyces tropicalis]|uniref:Uncharacterized protein n=1 Tax=Streptomyces tropicalis TaxID=3034234 RepID=A0ABT6A1B1_9ACTN|nr:hypothetical protein [Streptomyces tropicalis]MDF3298433.1 hypothetical protein [Streptomyces tropicalis]
MDDLASRAGGQPLVFSVVFLPAGLVALWCGLSWAFDVRGITTRRAQTSRRRAQAIRNPTGDLFGQPQRAGLFGSPGILRFLGAAMALGGLVMLIANYALWQLD